MLIIVTRFISTDQASHPFNNGEVLQGNSERSEYQVPKYNINSLGICPNIGFDTMR